MAEPAAPPTAAQVAAALRAAATPLRALDIARAIAGASKDGVNKVLYSGPFDRVDGPGAPLWRVRAPAALAPSDTPPPWPGHSAVHVDGVGFFYLRDSLSEAQAAAFLAHVAALIPAGTPPRARVDGSAGGQRLGRLAEKLLLAVAPL